MNRVRILANVLLTVVLAAAGLYVVSVETFVLGGPGPDGDALALTGIARHLLALSLFLLAAFAAAVARLWMREPLARPSDDEVTTHPAYRVRLMARYWYLIGPAIAALAVALWLAE